MCTEDKKPDSSIKDRLLAYGILPSRDLTRQEALCLIAQAMARRLGEVLEEIFPSCDLTWATISNEQLEEYLRDKRIDEAANK